LGSEILIVSTWQCWRSRLGDYYVNLILYVLEFCEQKITKW
jgi:hypothetical protein